MACKRFRIFAGGVLLTIALMRPNLPVLAGAALLMLVAFGIEHGLSDPSAKSRWMAFKRLVSATAVGMALVAAGLSIGSGGWPSRIGSPSEARHAMLMLAAYGLAILGAPLAAWRLPALRQPRRKRRVFLGLPRSRTLREMARVQQIRGRKIAV